jgi:hypothetical protein
MQIEIAVMNPEIAEGVREQAQTLGRCVAQDQPGGSFARGICVAVTASHALSWPTTCGQSRDMLSIRILTLGAAVE